MTSNLYKVGDWVFCEVSPHQPYVIRKIEELTKTQCGNVEAKVICAFRPQDIPPAIMATVEKYQAHSKQAEVAAAVAAAAEKNDAGNSTPNSNDKTDNNKDSTKPTTNNSDYDEVDVTDLNEQQRYNLKHRELYFSKYTDTIAATTIRSKCSVLLFNDEIERYSDYLNKDDSFYYHLTYDPYQKSIVADKGEIRVGSRYQTEIPSKLKLTPNGSILEDPNEAAIKQAEQELERNDRVLRSELKKMTSNGGQIEEVPMSIQSEELIWLPSCLLDDETGAAAFSFLKDYGCENKLDDRDVDKFLILAKSVGTFARALDCNNAFKQPSLPLSAAAASRDITLFHAMNTLHESNYDIGKACLSLITPTGPYICKDEMEDWSPSEANLFEDALEKFGKDFYEIRKEYLPWKCLKSIIEYYYTWKTTDRYVQQKKIKSTEQESKLKQVFIPNHSKQSALIKSVHVQHFNHYDVHLKPSCESCGTPNTSTNQWYVYNPSTLVQLIMAGNTNQTILSNAAAQIQATAVNNNNNSGANGTTSHSISQARFCADCWQYWKRYSSLKYPNARQERLNQIKNQLHKCSVNGCGKEFKLKQLLVKHCGIAHGYFAKPATPVGQNNGGPGGNQRPAPIRNRTAFYLHTTPMTQAARNVCTQTIRLQKLARKPFKIVELADLNKEWAKLPSRNITNILDKCTKKSRNGRISVKLNVKLIGVIARTRVKTLKQKRAGSGSGDAGSLTNGHDGCGGMLGEEEMTVDGGDQEYINDCHNGIDEKPEFLSYFNGNKCAEPCFVPESMAFPKLTSEQISNFHLKLMNQNRKRPHDQTLGSTPVTVCSIDLTGQTNGGSGSNDSSPLSKRTLMSNNSLNNIAQNSTKAANQLTKQTTTSSAAVDLSNNNNNNTTNVNNGKLPLQRISQKSTKPPTQSQNRVNAPDDIYYQINTKLNHLRHEVQIVALRKLARKPYKPLSSEYQQVYQTFENLNEKAQASIKSAKEATEATAKTTNMDTDIEMKKDEDNNNNIVIEDSENSNEKNDLIVDEAAETVEPTDVTENADDDNSEQQAAVSAVAKLPKTSETDERQEEKSDEVVLD
jgi:metastasis-associated protein MTA